MTEPWAVVVGVGNEYRGDDGIGPVVASRIENLHMPGVLVAISDGEPTSLLDIWTGFDLAVVIDAVRCVSPVPGRVRLTDIDLLRRAGTASSHSLGITDALPLGRVLGRLPARLVVVAVEVACLEPGVGLSEPVASAVPRAAEAVVGELRRSERTSRPRT